jgi:hypothetical protein
VAIQTAFMASSLVLVDDAFIGHTVDDRHGQNVSSLCFFGVFCVDGFDYILDVGALWLRRFSACFARFLAEGELATVELLERLFLK